MVGSRSRTAHSSYEQLVTAFLVANQFLLLPRLTSISVTFFVVREMVHYVDDLIVRDENLLLEFHARIRVI